MHCERAEIILVDYAYLGRGRRFRHPCVWAALLALAVLTLSVLCGFGFFNIKSVVSNIIYLLVIALLFGGTAVDRMSACIINGILCLLTENTVSFVFARLHGICPGEVWRYRTCLAALVISILLVGILVARFLCRWNHCSALDPLQALLMSFFPGVVVLLNIFIMISSNRRVPTLLDLMLTVGLTIAVLLARWGYDVTIFDARDKIGGVMRYGIPNYRLPDSVLDDFQYRHLELKGIKVRPNTTIGKTITIDDLFRDGYKSVFIGAGLWKANAMHIKGESLGNVAFGIDYLANSKAFRLGDDIAVIGVGNSAMDCARTAIRNGARHVTCYARRDESCISASAYEVSYAKLEGVGFRFCKAPVEIRENGLICRDTVKNEEGKFVQVEGSETFYPHTGVIVSVSQGSESNLVKTTTGIETNQKGLLTVSEDGSTTREGVFAGGDAVMGARTVVEAVAIAKQVAESMDKYMKSLPADTTPDPYANIPTFQTPTSDVLGKQEVK